MSSTDRLQFDQVLVAAGGRSIAHGEITKRLIKLHEELSLIKQTDSFDNSSLNEVIKQLKSPSLLEHKNQLVKSLTACCIADILKLFAPDSPYNKNELGAIFKLFLNQFKALGTPDSESISYDTYLISSLGAFKSIILILDLNNHTQLLIQIFEIFFSLTKKNQSKEILSSAAAILSALIDNSNSVPTKAIELILSCFTDKNRQQYPYSYYLAKELCLTSSDRLQRYFCQYFSDILLASNKPHEADPEKNIDLKTAHRVIVNINRAAPSVLLNVIPILEQELSTDNTELRTLATRALGEMFSQPGNLASTYQTVWKIWLQRMNDKVAQVRVAWVEQAITFFLNNSSELKQVQEGLINKVQDTDDKVRTAACKIVGLIGYDLVKQLVDVKLIEVLSFRCKDKKTETRIAALNTLSDLYDKAYGDIAYGDPIAITKFSKLPNSILGLFYVYEGDYHAAQVLREKIFSGDRNTSDRTQRLLNVCSYLNDKGLTAFYSMMKTQSGAMKNFSRYINSINEQRAWTSRTNSSDDIEKSILGSAKLLVEKYSDATVHYGNLVKYSQSPDKRLNELFLKLINFSSDYDAVVDCYNKAMKRIEHTNSEISTTFKMILNTVSLKLINHTILPFLFEIVESSKNTRSRKGANTDNTKAITAQKILDQLAHWFPNLFDAHLNFLTDFLTDSSIDLFKSEQIDRLKALAKHVKSHPHELKLDDLSIKKLKDLCVKGTVLQSKYAATVICLNSNYLICVPDLVSQLVKNLKISSNHLNSALKAFQQIAIHSPDDLEDVYEQIVKFVISELLYKDIKSSYDANSYEEFDQVDSELEAKVLGIKVLVNRALSFADDEIKVALCKPVLNLLWDILDKEGALTENIPKSFRANLRLTAVKSIVKLACKLHIQSHINSLNFSKLSYFMQDEIFEVRQGFVIKLIKYLSTQTLPPKFASVLFLTAHDPEVELRDTVTVALKRLLDKSKAQNNPVQLLESTTPRLIYLLAHHPDFSRDGEDLQQFQRYLEFFLEIIATPDNISYIFECVSRLKNVYDLNSPEKSDCIYALSDLMQYTIKHFKLTAHWLIQPYTGSVALPSDMYRHLTNPQKMATIANHNFLPQEFFPTDQTRAMAPPVSSNMFSGDGSVPKSPRSPRSPRSPKSPRSPRSPRSPKSPKSPRSSSKRSLPQDAEPRSPSSRRSKKASYSPMKYVEVDDE